MGWIFDWTAHILVLFQHDDQTGNTRNVRGAPIPRPKGLDVERSSTFSKARHFARQGREEGKASRDLIGRETRPASCAADGSTMAR